MFSTEQKVLFVVFSIDQDAVCFNATKITLRGKINKWDVICIQNYDLVTSN